MRSRSLEEGIMWMVLHFTELICHVVGGTDRSLYEAPDCDGNSFTVEPEYNEWMTVFTLCESDLGARLSAAPAASEVKEAHDRQT